MSMRFLGLISYGCLRAANCWLSRFNWSSRSVALKPSRPILMRSLIFFGVTQALWISLWLRWRVWAGRRRCETLGNSCAFLYAAHFVYPVDEEFPRLPDDFTPPTGVVSVRYTVDLANLPALGMEEAAELVKAANPCYA